MLKCRGDDWSAARLCLAVLFGKTHDERGAVGIDGLPGDGGIVFLDDFFDDGEAEACAAFFTARNEGIEERLGDGRRDAGAVVFDRERDAVAGVFGAYAYGAVSIDGFHSIFAQVDDDALELDFVTRYRAGVILFADELDAALFSLCFEEFQGMQEQRVHGGLSEDDGGFAARELKDLRAHALEIVDLAVDDFGKHGAFLCIAFRDHELRVAVDVCKGRFHIMEQRGHHLPDREKPLLFFLFLAIELCREGGGDMNGEEGSKLAVGVGENAGGFFLRAENERAEDLVVLEQRGDEEIVERLGEHGLGDFGQRLDFAQRDAPDLGLPDRF